MIPPNPAFRRVRVRPSLWLALAALALGPGTDARSPEQAGASQGAVRAATRPEAARSVAAPPAPAKKAPSVPALPQVPGAQPFPYLRGARPRPPARPDERVVFRLESSTGPQTFTLRQLQALPAALYTTYHPQLKQEAVYEGVPLRDLAALGGFAGQDLRVYASNGFVTTIRARDYLQEPVMLAYRMDGRPIPVLKKGPLTVVLPRRPERFYTPPYSAAWVWFAERLGPVP